MRPNKSLNKILENPHLIPSINESSCIVIHHVIAPACMTFYRKHFKTCLMST